MFDEVSLQYKKLHRTLILIFFNSDAMYKKFILLLWKN